MVVMLCGRSCSSGMTLELIRSIRDLRVLAALEVWHMLRDEVVPARAEFSGIY